MRVADTRAVERLTHDFSEPFQDGRLILDDQDSVDTRTDGGQGRDAACEQRTDGQLRERMSLALVRKYTQ